MTADAPSTLPTTIAGIFERLNVPHREHENFTICVLRHGRPENAVDYMADVVHVVGIIKSTADKLGLIRCPDYLIGVRTSWLSPIRIESGWFYGPYHARAAAVAEALAAHYDLWISFDSEGLWTWEVEGGKIAYVEHGDGGG